MTEFGGWGGVAGGRQLDAEDEFEMAVDRALGDSMRSSHEQCRRMWSALANMSWRHENGDTASYSFRAAGDLISAIIRRGDYLDWYCRGPYAYVSD